jgi:murein DD-endopeptidase MepM/ murein hydrolase activator NlpD
MMPKPISSILLVALILFTATPVLAQTATPPATTPEPSPTPANEPVYIIQSGDTLWSIANRFNITVDDLTTANPDVDPTLLAVGQKLVIPGLEGVSGVLNTEVIPYGDTFRSLSRRTQVSDAMLRKLNRLISPTELYAGTSLIVPVQEGALALSSRATIASGESLLELAVSQGSDPWVLAGINGLAGTWDALPGDVLYSPAGQTDSTANGLPAVFSSAELKDLPLKQGGTAEIRITLAQKATLSGTLVDYPLHFFQMEDGSFVALQGIHALLAPGAYPLKLEAKLEDGSTQTFEQNVLIVSGNYPDDPLLVVEPDTIDPTVTKPEEAQLVSIAAAATTQRFWNGGFISPASNYPGVNGYTSRYGNRRTYLGQGPNVEIHGFHTGLDFGGGTGLPITAPADGKVVFAGPLVVRGNATIIDHGWGVYSGFWHQSEIDVKVGDMVKQGQVIGLVGGTGRVTGPHLHWEVWVNGIQVDPLDWLNETFP